MRYSVRTRGPRAALAVALMIVTVACKLQPSPDGTNHRQSSVPLRPGEVGIAVDEGRPEQHIQTFDTLDFEIFSNQKWDRLGESHADDIIVTWPDGHDTRGIDRHIDDLKMLFVHAPDTSIQLHPIRIANGEWTAVTGVMTATFTQPMKMADGSVIQPTGKKFSLPMATIAHWKDGKMDHEWLYWDNAAYMSQLGLGK